jgi:hypothetical protein
MKEHTMNTIDRRQLLTSAVGAGAALAAGPWLESAASEDEKRPCYGFGG